MKKNWLNSRPPSITQSRQLKQYVSTASEIEWMMICVVQLQSKLQEEFNNHLYDRYHVNFSEMKPMDEGITDSVQRFDNQVVKPVNHERSFESRLKEQVISTPTVTLQNLTMNKP